MARRSLVLAVALIPACSYLWDDTAPDLPLVGGPPPPSSFQRYNEAPAEGEAFVQGKDGATWLTIFEHPNIIHNIRLTKPNLPQGVIPPPGEERWETPTGVEVDLTYRTFYFKKWDPRGVEKTRLTLRAAGEPEPGTVWELPPSKVEPRIYSGGPDDRFLYWVPTADTKQFTIYFRDGRDPVSYPIPKNINPAQPPYLFYNGAGNLLVIRDPTDVYSVYTTTKVTEPVSIKKRSKNFAVGFRDRRLDPENKSRECLLTFGADGIRWVPLDGSAESELEKDAVEDKKDVVWTYRYIAPTYHVFYKVGDEIREVPLDGSAPPKAVTKGVVTRLFGFVPDQAPERDRGGLFYSTESGSKFIYGVGDGWLSDWRFMERGRSAGFSRDGKKVRWLEHAAVVGGAGELMVAPIRGNPLRLARNVAQYEELADGRILALANRAAVGTHNRIIVIDEEAKEANWVCGAAQGYFHVPNSDDLMVQILTGPESHDLVRVPVPPKKSRPVDGGVDGGG